MDASTVPRYAEVPGANEAERQFAAWAIEQGWSITKRGWPDFICRRGQEMMCVEVKSGSDHLSHAQQATASDLAAHGIPCFEWRPPNCWDETDGVLKPVFETDRLVSDEHLSLRQACDRLATLNTGLALRVDSAARDAEKFRSAHSQVKAAAKTRIAALEAERAVLADDIGFLLRRFSETRYDSTRVRKLMRRYRQERETEFVWTATDLVIAKPCGTGWPA